MKARPILFSAPMIRALLSGSKTQTRRVVNLQPGELDRIWQMQDGTWHQSASDGSHMSPIGTRRGDCPYGQPGDLLWCRETWQLRDSSTHSGGVVYRADAPDAVDKWFSPRFMARAASRLTLALTDVRVERVQDISEEDAKAEGAPDAYFEEAFEIPDCLRTGRSFLKRAHHYGFQLLWESIHGRGAWERNDWVFALRFRVIHANVDDVVRAPAEYGVEAA